MLTSRIAVALALIGIGGAAASAQLAEESETIDALIACREIASPDEKLACFERGADALATAMETGRVVVVESRTDRSVERESFGLPLESLASLGGLFGRGDDGARPEAGPVEEVEQDGSVTVYDRSGRLDEMRGVPVERVAANRVGQLTVYLGDGQVWRQTDSASVRPIGERQRDGLTATVSRGAFSSYFMTLSHDTQRFRAERIDQ